MAGQRLQVTRVEPGDCHLQLIARVPVLTTYKQCQELQQKLEEDPQSALHVAAEVHPVSADDLSQDLSKVADGAKQDDWPSIIENLTRDAGRIAEDLHL